MKLHLEQRGGHEKALREKFTRFEYEGELEPISDPVCIILFTNRSGSTLVSDYLRATGEFAGMGEPLNHKLVCERADKWGVTTFPDYIAQDYARWRQPGKCYGMKASYDQAMMLVRARIIPSLLTQVRWVLIQRQDLLSQAISFTIAEQTKRWHSFDEPGGQQPEYDFERILQRIHALSLACSSLETFCAVMDIEPYRLNYTDFAQNPVAATRALARFLGKPNAVVDEARVKMRKQRSGINTVFKQRFHEDYQRRVQTTQDTVKESIVSPEEPEPTPGAGR